MRQKLIKDFFKEKIEEIKSLRIVERDLKVDFIQNKAISIVGPRRAGKTYFLKYLSKKHSSFFYIDFEHIAFRNLSPEEIFKLISFYVEITGEKPKILFLDEIQDLKEWNIVVRSLLDSGYFPIISGSSSKLLSKEVATELRGRSLSYLLLPFSFKEFLSLKGVEYKDYLTLAEEGKIKKLLNEYLFSSSFPEILITKNEKLIKEYYDTIFYRDFAERFKLKSFELARFIFDFFLMNFSNEFTINKIVNFFKSLGIKFGKNTVYGYVEKLPESLVVFFLERMEKSAYKKTWTKKVYVCDLGLANIVKFSKDFGKRMENLVFLELMRKTNKEPLITIYYWKDYQQHEVDFVIKEGLKVKQLIQVTYASGRDEIEQRELRALVKASEVLKCKDLLVITWDYEGEEILRGKKIRFVPLWRWLFSLGL